MTELLRNRFSGSIDAFITKFNASVSFDRKLALEDIEGSKAHCLMLAKVKVITEDEAVQINAGLDDIYQEIEAGEFNWLESLEDVHMNIEAALIKKIGDLGKKLHTGRSRNDQVATDLRLYLRNRLDEVLIKITQLQKNILTLAQEEAATIMPGFTHLQTAQPISFGHHLMAWFEMLKRDKDRFLDGRKRINISPLGSAALAGTSYPLDRHYTADLLNFSAPCENSLDGVSDRDFAIEFSFCASMTFMHLSRICEEIILWNSQAFDFIDLDETYCTTSSIMPQKKNPDVAELVRGKTGRIFGNLTALLTLMKSQPLAYNKDNQEDKEPIFDTVETLSDSLVALSGLVAGIKAKRDKMLDATKKGFATATDLADYLVKKGLAFRDSHSLVAEIIKESIEKNISLEDLSLEDLQKISPLIEADVYQHISLEACLNSRNIYGATAPKQVLAAIARAWKTL